MNGNNYLLENANRLSLKHKELAEKGGLSANMISQMKRGRRPINSDNALKLYIASEGKLSIKGLNPDLYDLLVRAGLMSEQA